MRRVASLGLMFVLGATLGILSGCTKSPAGASKADVSAQRAKFLLATEPEGGISVKAARELVLPASSASAEAKPAGDEKTTAAPADDKQPAAEAVKEDHAHEGHAHEGHDHDGHDHDAHAHAGHDHGDHDHADHDHAGHDHSHDGAYASAKSGKEVVIVGKIGGITDPWEKGKARFMISDLGDAAEHDHAGHDHAHHDHVHEEGHECPFCERAKAGADALAIVEFTDEQGKLLAIDARELFDLAKSQTVVIRGRANLGPAESLVISADGLFVRPDRK